MKLLKALTIPSFLFLLTGCESSHVGYSSAPTNRPISGAGPTPSPAIQRASEPWVDISITTAERQVIQGYVAGSVIEEQHPRKGKKPKGLPPGLQKKLDRGGTLPPGWEMKVRRGEILPVEVYEQCHRLPQEVMVKLPPQPPGTILISVGGKVARILAVTREILDVFEVEY